VQSKADKYSQLENRIKVNINNENKTKRAEKSEQQSM